MTQRTGRWIDLDERFAHRTDEAGFLTLGLAQMVTIFGFWMGTWPGAFGMHGPQLLASGLGALFAAAGAIGFYLAFRTLTIESDHQG